MDSSLIEKVAGWAAKRNALVFLDIQVGQSNLRDELPRRDVDGQVAGLGLQQRFEAREPLRAAEMPHALAIGGGQHPRTVQQRAKHAMRIAADRVFVDADGRTEHARFGQAAGEARVQRVQ